MEILWKWTCYTKLWVCYYVYICRYIYICTYMYNCIGVTHWSAVLGQSLTYYFHPKILCKSWVLLKSSAHLFLVSALETFLFIVCCRKETSKNLIWDGDCDWCWGTHKKCTGLKAVYLPFLHAQHYYPQEGITGLQLYKHIFSRILTT